MSSLDQLTAAIDYQFPELGIDFNEKEQRILIFKDSGDVMLVHRMKHEYDIDPIVLWLAENCYRRRMGESMVTLEKLISDAIARHEDDKGAFPKPIYEPQSLDGLPPEIRTSVRLRVVRRLVKKGYGGPDLRDALNIELNDDYQEQLLFADLNTISAQLMRYHAVEAPLRTWKIGVYLREKAEKLWEMGETKDFSTVMGMLIKFEVSVQKGTKTKRPNSMDDIFKNWTVEDHERYQRTGEVPKSKHPSHRSPAN